MVGSGSHGPNNLQRMPRSEIARYGSCGRMLPWREDLSNLAGCLNMWLVNDHDHASSMQRNGSLESCVSCIRAFCWKLANVQEM